MISRLTIHDRDGLMFHVQIRTKFMRTNSHQIFSVELTNAGLTTILRFDDDVSSETIATAIARKIWGNDERSKGWLPAAIAAGRQG